MTKKKKNWNIMMSCSTLQEKNQTKKKAIPERENWGEMRSWFYSSVWSVILEKEFHKALSDFYTLY